MSDPIPHTRNRLGNAISLITHPLVVFVPTLVIVMRHTDPVLAAAWIGFIALVILALAYIMMRWMRQQGRHTYQRESRHLIYLVFWVSMVICTALAVLLNAPERLRFSLLSLCVWVPLQSLINARCTKISIHVAVISGIAMALILMGELSSPPMIAAAAVVVLATAWARIMTGNHSPTQVSLGVMVSVASVLVARGVTLA